MAIYMEFTGTKTGKVKGGITTASYKDQIEVRALEFGLGHPIDVHSGSAAGGTVSRSVRVTKILDRASPLLMTCCCENEVASTVIFHFVTEGAGQKESSKLVLTNAMIHDFNILELPDGSSVETVALSYQKIEFTWVTDGVVAINDWAHRT